MTQRRGSMLLELTAATVILAALAGVCLKWFVAVTGQHRAADRRQAALREANNTLERAFACDWEQLVDQSKRQQSAVKPASASFPGGQVATELTQPSNEPGAIRIAVTVRWPAAQEGGGRADSSPPDAKSTSKGPPPSEVPAEQVRLTAWRFRGPSAGNPSPAQPAAKGAVK